MTIGQKITISRGKRGSGTKVEKGKIVVIEKRYIVVQFTNYREAFIKADVRNNIERDFQLG